MPPPTAELHALMKRFETAMNDRRLEDLDAMLNADFAAIRKWRRR